MAGYCLCTVSNDRYINGTAVMISSFLNHNKWFEGDIVVMHSNSLAVLSESGKDSLKRVFPNIQFKQVDDSCYTQLYNHFKNRIPLKRSVRALRFEAMSISGHDRVLYADSDILFTGDVSEMFKNDADFCTTRDGWGGRVFNTPVTCVKGTTNINLALFSMSSTFISKGYKQALIKYGIKYNLAEYDCIAYDQAVANKFFKNTTLCLMPTKYNVNRKWISDRKACSVNDIRVIHYSDEKPWILTPEGYKKSVDMWNCEFNKVDVKFHEKKPALKEATKNPVVKKVEPVATPKPKPILTQKPVNVNVNVSYSKIGAKYAVFTEYNNHTERMIKTLLEKNSWFDGDILVSGDFDISEFSKVYPRVIKADNYNGYDKVMYLNSSKKVYESLYGLFTQNHSRVEVVGGNNIIRVKKGGETSEPWFYFVNATVPCSTVVLFPVKYFEMSLDSFEDEYEAFIMELMKKQ